MERSFKGNPKKISLTSEASMFHHIEYDPKKREVVKQTLNIHRDGKVFWNEYILAPNFGHTLEKHRFKIDEVKAQEIIKDVAKHFETNLEDMACDAGMWEIEILCEDGELFNYYGMLGDVSEKLVEVSEKVRQLIPGQNIWAFDGNYGK